jgi:hypothetical protein
MKYVIQVLHAEEWVDLGTTDDYGLALARYDQACELSDAAVRLIGRELGVETVIEDEL